MATLVIDDLQNHEPIEFIVNSANDVDKLSKQLDKAYEELKSNGVINLNNTHTTTGSLFLEFSDYSLNFGEFCGGSFLLIDLDEDVLDEIGYPDSDLNEINPYPFLKWIIKFEKNV
ncbi:hypothetical protein [Polynucleobacter sp. MWH-HuK1]|uniref:hypothetical protein n=1 Tax=Polynucleobacter sp. MWH-HuK1 TaxID=1743158 RepID=UPI001C0C368A|nr:hypothetical protein [Polynucleobacter sp. MWH-HuK1]MBU3565251.1 hypothetical protein [Polynucleobacter sp. MWH-HuK1]